VPVVNRVEGAAQDADACDHGMDYTIEYA
jgi:hypothetical protein